MDKAPEIGDAARAATVRVTRRFDEITPRDRGCELVLTHRMDPRWAEYADRVRAGWTTMCDALARALQA